MKHLPLHLPGSVYASHMPFSGVCDPFHQLFAQYGMHAIDTVVMLISEDESVDNSGINVRTYYQQHGLDVIYLPIADFSTPDLDALSTAVEAAHAQALAGRNIAIHCHYGKGRTGLFAACLAKKVLGLSGDKAIEWVRTHIPGSVETPGQEALVRAFGEQNSPS